MLPNFDRFRGRIMIVAIAASAMVLAGCAYGPGKQRGGGISLNVQASSQTDLSIRISPDGKLEAEDKRSGKKFERCVLCTEAMEKEYGKKCKDLIVDKKEICKSLTGKTISEIQSMTIINSHASPGCTTIWFNGWPYQVCN